MRLEHVVLNCFYYHVPKGKHPVRPMLVRVLSKTAQRVWVVDEPEFTEAGEDLRTRRLNQFMVQPERLRPLPVSLLCGYVDIGRVAAEVVVIELTHRIHALCADVSNLGADIQARVRVEIEVRE